MSIFWTSFSNKTKAEDYAASLRNLGYEPSLTELPNALPLYRYVVSFTNKDKGTT